MKIALEAFQKFWVKYEPNKPPKSEEIKTWLREQKIEGRKISEREVGEIDSIIRPLEYKRGGNRTIRNKKG